MNNNLKFNRLCRNGFQKTFCAKIHQIDECEDDERAPTEQTEHEPNQKEEEDATTFVNDIKNAAMQAQSETGFVYEPTSGLYYDSRTGYYYNAVNPAK